MLYISLKPNIANNAFKKKKTNSYGNVRSASAVTTNLLFLPINFFNTYHF